MEAAPAAGITLSEGIEAAENAEDIPKQKTGTLSTPSLVSHTSMSSVMPPSCDYGYHKILGWLRFVDDILDKHRTNELLYLGAYYEIKESLMEKCKRPSEFYLLLRDSRAASGAQVLARFMYALQGLGRKGNYCIREFSKKTSSTPPSTVEFRSLEREDKHFAFCQCLVKMCLALKEESNISRCFRRYVCHHILVVAPQNEETVAKVFLRWMKRPQIFSEEKHEQLALALDQVGARACLIILQNFRSQFGMPEIEVENLTPYPRDDNISLAPSSSNSSTTFRSTHSSLQSHGSRPCSPTDLDTGDINQRELLLHDRLARMDLHVPATEETPLMGEIAEGRLLPPTYPPRATETPPVVVVDKRCKWRYLLVVVFTLGVVLTTAAGLTMIVLAATQSSSVASLTNVYSNTTVALGDVQRFTTQKVIVYQQPGNNEVNIPLTFYRYDGSCSSLPAKISEPDLVNNESVALQPQVVLSRGYLMPHSLLNYTFCAVTNHLNGTQYHIGLYVAEILDEALQFDPKRYHYSLDKDIPLVYDSNLQPNDDCFLNISHKVTRQGPYSVIIFPPEQSEVPFTNIKLWYSENSELRVIDTSQLTQLCTYNPAVPTKPCNISVGLREHFISLFCVVVGVGYSEYDAFTNVRVALTASDTGKIWFYVVGGFLIASFSCVFVVLVVLVCLNCRDMRT